MNEFESAATKLLSEMEEYLRNGGRESDVVIGVDGANPLLQLWGKPERTGGFAILTRIVV